MPVQDGQSSTAEDFMTYTYWLLINGHRTDCAKSLALLFVRYVCAAVGDTR
jgi:hypothetical protein